MAFQIIPVNELVVFQPKSLAVGKLTATIVFPNKPSDQTLMRLKGGGFYYDKSAWHINASDALAVSVAMQIINELGVVVTEQSERVSLLGSMGYTGNFAMLPDHVKPGGVAAIFNQPINLDNINPFGEPLHTDEQRANDQING